MASFVTDRRDPMSIVKKFVLSSLLLTSPLFAKQIKHPTCHLHLIIDSGISSYDSNVKRLFQKRGYTTIETRYSDRHKLTKGELTLSLGIQYGRWFMINMAVVSLSLQQIVEQGKKWAPGQSSVAPVIADLSSGKSAQRSIGSSIYYGRALKNRILALPKCVQSFGVNNIP